MAALPPVLSPVFTPVRQATSLPLHPVYVSSVSSVSEGTSFAGSPMMGSLLAGHPVTYRKVVPMPVKTTYSVYQPPMQYPQPPRYPTAWTKPRPTLLLGAPSAPAHPAQPPRPEHINITVIRGKQAKPCNCSNKTASTVPSTTPRPPPPEDPAPVDEEVEDEVPHPGLATSTPVPLLWAGYIPEDILQHAKQVLANNGKVSLTTNATTRNIEPY